MSRIVSFAVSNNNKVINAQLPSSGILIFDSSTKYGFKSLTETDLVKSVRPTQPTILSPFGLSVLDTFSLPKTFILPNGTFGSYKIISLKESRSYTATIITGDCGEILLNPGDNPIELIYTDKWIVISHNVPLFPGNNKSEFDEVSISGSAEGLSVDISDSGNTMVVGVPGYSYNPAISPNRGVILIYEKIDNIWGEPTYRSQNEFYSNEGWSVAISAIGDTIVAGAPTYNSNYGRIVVYTKNNGIWDNGIQLSINNNISPGKEGYSVAISANGKRIVTGIPYYTSGLYNIGGTIIYDKDTTWGYTTTLLYQNNNNTREGYSVDISADGSTIISGIPSYNETGGVVVYVDNVGSFTTTMLSHTPNTPLDEGKSVSISADGYTIVTGAPNYFVNFPSGEGTTEHVYGAIFIYNRLSNINTWDSGKLYTQSIRYANEGTSTSISADGLTIAAGSPSRINEDEDGIPGSTIIYTKQNNEWVYTKKIGPNYTEITLEGNSVALTSDGSTILIGTPTWPTLGSYNGKVLLYK